ncbi:MAG: dehydrogenase, partial [Metallosphaera sp.]
MIACTRDCYDTCVFDENYQPVKGEPTFGFTCSRGRMDLRRNEMNRVDSAYVDGKQVGLEQAVSLISRALRGV